MTVNAMKAAADLENLKRLSLRWMIRKGVSLAEAEDLFQQSMLKALTSPAELQDRQKLQSWFMAILKNTLLDAYRAKKLHAAKEKEYQFETELQKEEAAVEESFCKCVNNLIQDLPESDQSLLQQHFFEGKTFASLAKASGQNESQLRVKSHRARDKLKAMFNDCCQVRKFRDLQDCGCE